MPGKMSSYLQNAMLQHILGQATYTFPATNNLYVGLCTAFDEAQDGNSFTEVSTAEYARQPVAFAAPVAQTVSNTGKLAYAKAVTTWGTPTYWIVCDALTGGNVLFWGAVTSPLSINANEQLEIGVSQLTITLSGAATPTLANEIFNSVLRGQSWTTTAPTHTALLSAFTSESTWTETADTAYGRQAVTWTTATGGASSNAAQVQYPAVRTLLFL